MPDSSEGPSTPSILRQTGCPRSLFRSLGFPVARPLADFRFAGDRVAAQLSVVLDDELLAVALARDLELHVAVLEGPFFDRRLLAVAAGDRARELVALEL